MVLDNVKRFFEKNLDFYLPSLLMIKLKVHQGEVKDVLPLFLFPLIELFLPWQICRDSPEVFTEQTML